MPSYLKLRVPFFFSKVHSKFNATLLMMQYGLRSTVREAPCQQPNNSCKTLADDIQKSTAHLVFTPPIRAESRGKKRIVFSCIFYSTKHTKKTEVHQTASLNFVAFTSPWSCSWTCSGTNGCVVGEKADAEACKEEAAAAGDGWVPGG